MNTVLRKVLATVGLVAVGTLYSASASAQCSAAFPPQLQKQAWHGQAPRLMKVDWHDDDEDIIGFWNIVLTSKGSTGIPDGTILDKGLQQWHPGGTEFLNSSGQHPLTQNYCMGAWKRVGRSTYVLNHFAYSYDTNQNVIGLARIQEDVTVSRDGMHYAGTFRIRGYDNARNVVYEFKGTVAGTRITTDTTASEVL